MDNVSVITGGTGGMGLEVAKRLSKYTKVMLCGRRKSKLDEARWLLMDYNNIEYVIMDVSKRDDIQAAVDTAQKLGVVKNVIHTAGVNEYAGGKPNEASYILENNIKGVQYVAEGFLPIICEGGSYVNVASMSSYYYPIEDYLDAFKEALKGNFDPVEALVGEEGAKAYAISKLFVRWYTMCSIDRASARGARINSISPGLIWTPMSKEFEEKLPGSMTAFASTLPIGRMGKSEEIADLVEFLCRPGYIHGEDILIDGGNINYCRYDQFDLF